MLKGPLPLLISREEMQDDISVSLVGERKNELLLEPPDLIYFRFVIIIISIVFLFFLH